MRSLLVLVLAFVSVSMFAQKKVDVELFVELNEYYIGLEEKINEELTAVGGEMVVSGTVEEWCAFGAYIIEYSEPIMEHMDLYQDKIYEYEDKYSSKAKYATLIQLKKNTLMHMVQVDRTLGALLGDVSSFMSYYCED